MTAGIDIARIDEDASRYGLAEEQKYGAVHLTEQGSEEAARYSLGCAQLSEKLKAALGLSEDVCSHIACTVLAELPEQLAVLSE